MLLDEGGMDFPLSAGAPPEVKARFRHSGGMETLGYVGAGNMAGALARGLGDPVLATDSGSGRAASLVEELGGEAAASNAEVAERADVVVLGFKPYQLGDLAPELQAARRVISLLGGVDLEALRTAFPDAMVAVAIPNTAVEVRRGVTLVQEGSEPEAEVRALLERVGSVAILPPRLMGPAAGIAGVGPAYLAVITEAWVDAGIRAGLKGPQASELATEALAGAAELLRHNHGDTLGMRRAVTSPGGTTARGLRALDAAGLRDAMQAAMDATLGQGPRS
jgi:pyrroline-5-carboxylate reductase